LIFETRITIFSIGILEYCCFYWEMEMKEFLMISSIWKVGFSSGDGWVISGDEKNGGCGGSSPW
jgi:hypothetical protein